MACFDKEDEDEDEDEDEVAFGPSVAAVVAAVVAVKEGNSSLCGGETMI